MDEFKVKDFVYRIKKMNAIELLALQSQIGFSNMQAAKDCYNIMLENIEVKVKDVFLPVKEEGKNIYLPNDIENDIESVQELIKHMIEYLKEVFSKSNI